jgi:hypothetical protein
MSLTEKALEVHVLHLLIAADAGCAGVGRHGRNRNESRSKSPWSRAQRAAGLRAAMERTGIEPVTSGLQSRRSPS